MGCLGPGPYWAPLEVQDGRCLGCGAEEETDFHRVWECPCNLNSEDEWIRSAFENSEVMLEHARKRTAESGEGAFWARGMIPKEWTEAERTFRVRHTSEHFGKHELGAAM